MSDHIIFVVGMLVVATMRGGRKGRRLKQVCECVLQTTTRIRHGFIKMEVEQWAVCFGRLYVIRFPI